MSDRMEREDKIVLSKYETLNGWADESERETNGSAVSAMATSSVTSVMDYQALRVGLCLLVWS